MPWLLNVAYLLLLTVLSPFLLYKALLTGKYREGMLRKLTGRTGLRPVDRPRAWFHAVSVGEVLLLKSVIEQFRRRHGEWDVVVSTTTNTAFDVARKTYPDLSIFYWPLDFSWSVRRALREVRPRLLVLAELELWPNAIAAAYRNGIPIAVINGRMSPRSFRGYRRVAWLMRRLLKNIRVLAMQTEAYANRIVELGAPTEHVHVTGSVKYDGAITDRANPRTQNLAKLLRWPLPGTGDGMTWVVGSTQAPEEAIALGIYRRLLTYVPGLRLLLVPRHKERFEEVAKLLADCGMPYVRRSHLGETSPIVLLDTLGELGAAWGLADVAFVGGSLSTRGGQNMIEPAAYGAAVTFGPNVWNFQDTVERLLACEAALQIKNEGDLEQVTLRLLTHAVERQRLGSAARAFVLSQQGATARTLELLDALIDSRPHAAAA